MTAQTFTGTRAADAFPVFQPMGSGNVAAAYGSFTITETPEVGDIFELCKLPYGAVPIAGFLSTTDIDTGTETFELDLGYAANGVDAADPDFFVNSGVLTGDVITDLLAAGKNYRPFVPTSFAALGAETTVQAEVIAVAAAGATGTLACVVFYVVP